MENTKVLEQKLVLLDDLQSACTHCGLCLEACATYQASGWEHESPRGRIRLARDFINGHIQPNSKALETFDRCLGCRACERICPSNVQYGELRHLVQDVRLLVDKQQQEVPVSRETYRNWIKLANRIGSWLWRSYGHRWLSWPTQGKRSYLYKNGKNSPSLTTSLTTVRLAVSCVQDVYQQSLIEKAADVFNRLGFEVHFDQQQPCCGAIFNRLIEGGKESICYLKEKEHALNRQHIRSRKFTDWLVAPTCFLSSDCGCFLRRQPNQNKDLIVDIYEFILNALQQKQLRFVLPQPLTVYYQPYCCSNKGSTSDFAKAFLESIVGLTVKYLPQPYACCGGYAYESIWNEEQAKHILNQKTQNISEQSIIVVTSADCYNQFLMHANKISLQIVYPIQVACWAQLRS